MTRAQLPNELGRSRYRTQVEVAHDIFAVAAHGPFRCDTCEYYSSGGCHHEDINRLAKTEQGRRMGLEFRDGLARVQAADCCDYHEKDEG